MVRVFNALTMEGCGDPIHFFLHHSLHPPLPTPFSHPSLPPPHLSPSHLPHRPLRRLSLVDEVVRRLGQEEPVDAWVSCKQQPLSWTRRGSGGAELHAGRRPPQSGTREPGEWPRSWQYWTSSVLDTHFRKNSMLTNRTASRQAHLRSHSARSRFLTRANDSIVHRPSSLVQGSVVGALATSVALDGGNVQWMPRAAQPTRQTPGSLHTFRTYQEEVITDRAGARECAMRQVHG